jgi:hypothetical protein
MIVIVASTHEIKLPKSKVRAEPDRVNIHTSHRTQGLADEPVLAGPIG